MGFDYTKEVKIDLLEQEIFRNSNSHHSIYNNAGGLWSSFLYGVIACVSNIEKNTYPIAKLNPNGSVAFFCDSHEDDSEFKKSFEKSIKKGFIVKSGDSDSGFMLKQLILYARDNGLEPVGGKQIFFEAQTNNVGVSTYTINLHPRDLDTFFKRSHVYQGYRGPSGLLNLTGEFTPNPQTIRLFPVAHLSDNDYCIRAAGCQSTEMMGVGLLCLLPGHSGKIEHYHRAPGKVVEKLCNYMDIENLLHNQMVAQAMLSPNKQWDSSNPDPEQLKDNFSLQSMEGYKTIKYDPTHPECKIKIRPMDADAREFYTRFSNLDPSEIAQSLSAEISTTDCIDLLTQHIQKNLAECEMPDSEVYNKETLIPKYKNSLELLEQMRHNSIAIKPSSKDDIKLGKHQARLAKTRSDNGIV